jgi:hypothetical protein
MEERRTFYTFFWNDLNKSNTGDLYVMPFGNYELREERCSVSRSVPNGLYTFICLKMMFVVPYILVTYAFIQFQQDVLYALFLS